MSSQRTSKTLLDLRTEVMFNAGNRSDLVTQATNAVNLAVEEICRLHPWRSLRTTTSYLLAAGDSSVEVDAYDIQEARIQVTERQVYPLRLVTKNKFLDQFPTVEGIAQYWPRLGYFDQGIFFFGPKVSAVYTLILTRILLPDKMVNDTDTVPLRADLAVICWASSHLLAQIGMHELVPVWDAKFAQSVQNAIIDENRMVGVQHRNDEFEAKERNVGGTPWLDPFVKGT